MPKTEIAVAELMWNLIAGKTGNVGRVEFTAQKPEFPGPESAEGLRETHLERAVPESLGVSSLHLAGFLRMLADQKSTDIHQVLVTRAGKVICECGYAPYQAGMWHAGYSLCKSITGMAIGMLEAEGKISRNDRVIDFFRRKRGLINGIRQKDVTVERLLTMTACVNFNETGIVSGSDWVHGFLEAGLSGVPGQDFQYNSMNSYMLSAIITEVTGESMMEYLRPRLWEPLGISRIFWESCPMGITKGGWGLFIRPEDAAKLGILYLHHGIWQGKQIVPAEWVEDSCALHVKTPSVMSNHGYGYQMWMGSREGSFNYNGMLGQNVVVYPDMDMVVVTNAGSHDMFQNCVLMNIVKQFFEADYMPQDRLAYDPAAYDRLCRTIRMLSVQETAAPAIRGGGWGGRGKGVAGGGFGPEKGRIRDRFGLRKGAAGGRSGREILYSLDGRQYEMEEKHVGLMPLMMQVMHNNYSGGIQRIGFTVRNGSLFLHLWEGGDRHVLRIGLDEAACTCVSFHGEAYLIGTKGEFAADEDGRPVLKLDFAFLEEACRRKLKLHFDGDMIEARWDETPGKDVIMEGLDAFAGSGGHMGFLMNAVKEVGGADVFHILVERTVEPVCRGKLAEADEENETESNMSEEHDAGTENDNMRIHAADSKI